MTKNAAKYRRVSHDRQEKEGFSLPAQDKLLDEYAAKNDIKVVASFCETETAKKSDIIFAKSATKPSLMEFVKVNSLLTEEMQKYTIISATELFTTSKDIISFLHKNRSRYVENKKVVKIKLLREDCNIIFRSEK